MGLPIKEYFIWGDDKEYTLRLSASYPCYHVKDSVVIHKMAINAGSNIVIDAIARVPRYFYAFRNDLCTAKRRGTKEIIIYFAAFLPEYAARTVKKQRWEKAAFTDDVEGNARGREICTEIGEVT